jgi:hypothetical protein
MLDALNQYSASCLLFIASVMVVLHGRSHLTVSAFSMPPKPKVSSKEAVAKDSVLVELLFPGTQEIQRMKNDIVLSKAMNGTISLISLISHNKLCA